MNTKQNNDIELLRKFSQDNDHSAFNELVDRYKNLVWKVAYSFTSDTQETQDILQDTFIRLFESAPKFKPDASLSTYIYRIVTNLCIDHKKKKRPDIHDNIDSFPSDTISSSDQLLENKHNLIFLNKALRKLPERQRLAIIYKYDHNLPVKDIAEILKVSEKAVERLLAHGRETLKTIFEKNKL
ncbi:MAG: RNA polymerase sigma factor [Fibrobacterota bacterium]|jgi:RNA polymerase sigma-70 factor (ECF subfamily)|nr:sigma-70 family RNA polymerase sigma factor [Chitinispirillaceae bacterium]